MTVHYESPRPGTPYPQAFGVPAPTFALPQELWPRQMGGFIRVRTANPVSAEPTEERELGAGQFGLVPRWVKSASDARLRAPKLVNARSETLTTSNAVREAWLAGQRCVVPLQAFFEDDWRSGKAVHTRIARVDGRPLGAAGVWERWQSADGTEIVSFTLLTVNANAHALLHRYQQPGAEKRMPALLNEGSYGAWLHAPQPERARELLRAYPASALLANPVQKG